MKKRKKKIWRIYIFLINIINFKSFHFIVLKSVSYNSSFSFTYNRVFFILLFVIKASKIILSTKSHSGRTVRRGLCCWCSWCWCCLNLLFTRQDNTELSWYLWWPLSPSLYLSLPLSISISPSLSLYIYVYIYLYIYIYIYMHMYMYMYMCM